MCVALLDQMHPVRSCLLAAYLDVAKVVEAQFGAEAVLGVDVRLEYVLVALEVGQAVVNQGEVCAGVCFESLLFRVVE